MATRDYSLDLPILQSAKKEFFEKKYEKASLKCIADSANVSTGALYIRYKGKEDLFHAVVEKCLTQVDNIFAEKYNADFSMMTDDELLKAWTMDETYMLWWFDFFDHYHDEFTLLFKCSMGTKYENYQHDLVDMMTEVSYKCYEELYKRKLAKTEITRKEMHVLLTAFANMIFEPFVHDFTKSEIAKICIYACQLFAWQKLIYNNE